MNFAATPALHETPPEPAFDRVTKLVSAMLDVPVSLFSIANEDRLYFKSNHGMGGPYAAAGSAPLSDTACQYVIGEGQPVPVEDAWRDGLLGSHKVVTDLGIQGYLGYPVCNPSGTPFGSLCAVASGPRRWNDRDIETMATLAKAIEAEVSLRSVLASRDDTLRELRRTYAALDAARDIERELGEQTRFFTSLSHEIRTPLNHLLGGVSLLEITRDEAQRAVYGGMIRDSAEALTRFVDDLVGFARDTTGRTTSRPERFDPRDPVRYALKSVAGGAAEKGLALRSEIAPDLPESWVSEPARVERLLINLAGNAIKFTSSGSVTLSATLETGRLVYRVCDTGPGIDLEYRERIFEPFDRGDPEVSRKTNGSGLGLSIARSSARLIGADLSVEDHPGRPGVCFRLMLDAA